MVIRHDHSHQLKYATFNKFLVDFYCIALRFNKV